MICIHGSHGFCERCAKSVHNGASPEFIEMLRNTYDMAMSMQKMEQEEKERSTDRMVTALNFSKG